MATWATQRKTRYAMVFFISLVVVIGLPIFFFTYNKPTCFDKVMNGDESGVDCGGSCVRLCQSAYITPRVIWGGARFENVGPGLYNAAAYIENPNVSGGALNVPYEITFLDSLGQVIGKRNGKVNLYPHRNSLAFESLIKFENATPAKAIFRFTSDPEWFKSEDDLGYISIVSKDYRDNEEGSSLSVILENKSLLAYKDITVGVILTDASSNVIGFSQTKIDKIGPKGGRETAVFTWPNGRDGRVIGEEIVLSSMPVSLNN